MAKFSVTHTVYRNDDETVIEVEATGDFYRGELEGWTHTSNPKVELTQDEADEIVGKLMAEASEDWDETKYQSAKDMT